jgi:hypothetical protein
MQAYIYQAALLCEECGEEGCRKLIAQGKAPEDPTDEYSFDSDWFPKGPYLDGGGEADCPQHCDHCEVFLRNSLTTDGYEYAREQAANSCADSVARTEWAPFYGIDTE